jgi:hypothetical protein
MRGGMKKIPPWLIFTGNTVLSGGNCKLSALRKSAIVLVDLFNNLAGCCWTNVRQVSQMWQISYKNPPHLLFFNGSCSTTEVIEQL